MCDTNNVSVEAVDFGAISMDDYESYRHYYFSFLVHKQSSWNYHWWTDYKIWINDCEFILPKKDETLIRIVYTNRWHWGCYYNTHYFLSTTEVFPLICSWFSREFMCII